MGNTRKRVLVIDDEANTRMLVSIALKNHGFDVLVADSAAAAKRVLADEAVDALILDVMMPDVTGFELCRELKGSEATRRLKVLILSGVAQGMVRGDAHWREKSGADDFLSKPFRLSDLVTRVRALLEGRTLARTG